MRKYILNKYDFYTGAYVSCSETLTINDILKICYYQESDTCSYQLVDMIDGGMGAIFKDKDELAKYLIENKYYLVSQKQMAKLLYIYDLELKITRLKSGLGKK